MSIRTKQGKFGKPTLLKGQSTLAGFFGCSNLGNNPFKPPTIKHHTLNKANSFNNGDNKGDNIGDNKGDDKVITKGDSFLNKGDFKDNSILNRSDSFLNTIIVDDEFEENKSPDTSFEVENFLNPSLSNRFNKITENDNHQDKSLKRSNFFTDNFSGQPRKAQKTVVSTTLNTSKNLSSRNSTNLSDEQLLVIREVIESRKNIFYTGSAGTGKSVVLKKLVEKLRIIHGNNMGVTASTGMAACNINGQTVHKYLGIGIGSGSALEISKRIKRNRTVLRRWQILKVLIIDEISMIDGILFDKLNEIGQLLRGNKKPFGGIQLVCTGDFFQLPPVCKGSKPTYCFQAKSWNSVIDKKIVLTKVFRQKGDNELITMLNALRSGSLTNEITVKFKQLSRKVSYADGIEPTELFPTRQEVKNANLSRMKQLSGPIKVFNAIDSQIKDGRPEILKQLDNLMCEKELILKEGAQVMYLKNTDEIVNGSIGTILFFLTKELWVKVFEIYGDDLDDPKIIQEIRLLSRRIGCTDDWTESESQMFNKVVPLTRISVFRKLCLLASQGEPSLAYPIVNFKRPKYMDLPLFVEPFEFKIDGSTRNDEELSRRQLPIILAWAMSIHKAQGQTIDRLRIDLTKSFEMGQIYVALSRATSKDHLEVKNFEPYKVKVSEDVVKFYNT